MLADEDQYGRFRDLVDLAVLQAARVTVIGAGSMGNPVILHLADVGVGSKGGGRIRIIDGDVVSLRNLSGTGYGKSHVGISKPKATTALIHEKDPDINVSAWERQLVPTDIPDLVRQAHMSDLVCHFYDDWAIFGRAADACHDTCCQIAAFFGEECSTAEIGFSIPGITPRLSFTMGQRKRRAIGKPRALGTDTASVAAFVAHVCLGLLLGDARGSEYFPCHSDAPLLLMGLRPVWIFEKQPFDLVRSVYCVGMPTAHSK
jgi:hypothetical protein